MTFQLETVCNSTRDSNDIFINILLLLLPHPLSLLLRPPLPYHLQLEVCQVNLVFLELPVHGTATTTEKTSSQEKNPEGQQDGEGKASDNPTVNRSKRIPVREGMVEKIERFKKPCANIGNVNFELTQI